MNKLKEKEAANAKKLGMQWRFVQQTQQQKSLKKSSAEIDSVVYYIRFKSYTINYATTFIS